MTQWTAPPRLDVWQDADRPKRKLHRRVLTAIAIAWFNVRHSRKEPYVKGRLALAYLSLGLVAFGLGIMIVFALN